jgi:predicted transcriptional regulator
MSELSLLEKVALASELSTEIIVGILRRRAAAKTMDIGTLLTEATNNSQEADQILDELAAKTEPGE